MQMHSFMITKLNQNFSNTITSWKHNETCKFQTNLTRATRNYWVVVIGSLGSYTLYYRLWINWITDIDTNK